MRPRATAKLASRPLPELFDALAEGMSLIAEHVATLEHAATQQQGAHAARTAAAIRAISDEEAGKFLVLLDVARGARSSPGVKARQLRRAGDHLAKGIYARAAEIRPASYGELLRYVNMLRRSHYLDGPNDVDWIFRNEIEAAREGRLYVDFVESDDGDAWVSPSRFDDIGFISPPEATELVCALRRAGFCNPDALAAVADVWHGFIAEPETHWVENERLSIETLERAQEATGKPIADGDIAWIARTWTFPLYQADLARVVLELDVLRERQRQWDPGFY
jgi:hypothetical protein